MLTALRVSKGGNPGETRTGPPIETFGGDKLGHVHGVLSFLSRTIDPTLLTGSSPVKLRFPKLQSFVTLVDLYGDKVFHHTVDGWSFSVERMIRLRAERLLDTFRLAWIYHDGISLLDEKTSVRGAVCESPGLAQSKTCRNNNLDPSRHPTVCGRGLAGRLERCAHCR